MRRKKTMALRPEVGTAMQSQRRRPERAPQRLQRWEGGQGIPLLAWYQESVRPVKEERKKVKDRDKGIADIYASGSTKKVVGH